MKYIIAVVLTMWFTRGKCQQQEFIETKKANTELYLTLLFPGFDKASLMLWLPYEYTERIKPVPITFENGKFIAKFDLDKPALVSLSYGSRGLKPYSASHNGNFLIIEPGEKLNIIIPTMESKLFDDVKIEGKISAPKARLMREINIAMEELSKNSNLNSARKHDILQFGIDSYKTIDSILNTYKGVVSDSALNLIRFRNYATYNASIVNKAQLLDSAKSNYKEQFKKLEVLFPTRELMYNGKFWVPVANHNVLIDRAIAMYAIDNSKTFASVKGLTRDPSKMISVIKAYYANPIISEALTVTFLMECFRTSGFTKDLIALAEAFTGKSNTKSAPIIHLKNFIANSGENMKPGAKAYAFNLLNDQKKNVSLKDFAGKVVLIDFMYNGCPGCKLMVPSLEEVEKHFIGKDVKFVSVSIDDDFNRFLAAGGIFNTKNSTHLYTNGQSQFHEIIRHYQIRTYPTLVLIDKSGNLMTARAPDPRNADAKRELIAKIEAAL